MSQLDELCKVPVREIWLAEESAKLDGREFKVYDGEMKKRLNAIGNTELDTCTPFVDRASYERLKRALEKCRLQRNEWADAESSALARNLIELNLKSQDEALAVILQAKMRT